MTSTDASKPNDKGHRLVMRVIICAAILLVGIGGFIAQAIALYPIRIKETASSLAGAQARLTQARINLERCRIVAPFTGRLTMTAVGGCSRPGF